MPPDSNKTVAQDLRVAAARYALGVLASWDIPPLADSVLSRGVYSDAIAELSAVSNPTMSDVGPLFERALRELGIPAPDQETAPWFLLHRHIADIAAGRVSPRDGLARVVHEVYYPGRLDEKSRDCAGDSHGISKLYGMYWSYDDLDNPLAWHDSPKDQAAYSALDRRVVAEATRWLEAHPTSGSPGLPLPP